MLGAFGIPADAAETVRPLSSGHGPNRKLHLQALGQDWILTRFGEGRREALRRSTHELEAALADQGFPVAPLKPASSGEVVVRHHGADYSLRQVVRGRHHSIADREALHVQDPTLADRLGTLVGTMHRVSSRLAQSGAATRTDPDHLLKAPRYAVRALRRPRRRPLRASRWQSLQRSRHQSDFDRWILRTVPEVMARARALSTCSIADRVGPGDTGLAHHDLNWENLIFDDALQVRAVIDFDNAIHLPWALEVGAAAVVLIGTDPARLTRFVTAYEQASGITLDPELVGLGMEVKCVQSILNGVIGHLDDPTGQARRRDWTGHLHASLQDLTTKPGLHAGAGSLRPLGPR